MCSVKSRVGTLGGPASSMSTLRPRSATSLATQPPLAPDPTMSTSCGMVCTNRLQRTQPEVRMQDAKCSESDRFYISHCASSIQGAAFHHPVKPTRPTRKVRTRGSLLGRPCTFKRVETPQLNGVGVATVEKTRWYSA